MKTAIILGADRVGKTTLIDKSARLLSDTGRVPYRLHFSGVLPSHNSPIDQFIEPLSTMVAPDAIDVLFCDRFSPDTLFCEPYRYQTGSHPPEVSNFVESAYMEMSEEINVILLCPPWDDNIRERHEVELRDKYKTASEWWINKMVLNREKEHSAYYEFMYDYFENHSLFKSNQVFFKLSATSIFDILPSYVPGV